MAISYLNQHMKIQPTQKQMTSGRSFLAMKSTKSLWVVLTLFSALQFSCTDSDLDTVVEIQEEFSDITSIEVDAEFLDVSYVGTSGQSQVSLSANVRSNSKRRNEVKYLVEGNKLKIEVNSKGGIRSLKSEGSIILTGPRNISLDLESGSGTIEVSNVTGQKTDLEAGSGKIIAKNINSSEIELEVASGSILAEDLTGKVSVEVASGKMEINRVDGNVTAQGASGQMKITAVNGTVKAGISSGNIEMSEIRSLGRVELSSGKLFATSTGLSAETSLKASSGTMYIQTPSNLSLFNFNITTGSGSARVGESVSSGTLNINNGSSFTIRGEVNSGKIEIVN